jgi:hypothetical protein
MAGSAGVTTIQEHTMKLPSRSLAWILIAAAPFAACTADTSAPDGLAQSSDELKGGIPASSQGKGRAKGDGGAAGDDAGVDEQPGKGGKDKPKKDKPNKGPKGDGGRDVDEDMDENADESADADEPSDESADTGEGV